MAPIPEWAEDQCTCDHPASAHDDGFGCTEQRGEWPCPCLAGWRWSTNES